MAFIRGRDGRYHAPATADAPERTTMMSLALRGFSVQAFASMLRALSAILDKAAAQAAERDLDLAALPQARLAPDMYTLTQQVQLACFHALNGVRQLAREAPPPMGEADGTMAALKARIDQTLATLEAMPPAAFEGAAERQIVFPGPPGMEFAMTGAEFLRDWALPHFYFHLVTAYDILRHQGVEIGKRDYLSGVGRYLRPMG
jgi:hypothetical protein